MPEKRRRKPAAISLNFDNKEEPYKLRNQIQTPPHQKDPFLKGMILEAGLLDSDFASSYLLGVRTKISETQFQDPYPQAFKARLANMYQFDHIARIGVDTYVYYLLGKNPRAKLYPNGQYGESTDSEITSLLNSIITPQEQKQLQDHIDNIDHVSELYDYDKLGSAIASYIVYGRSALLKSPSKNDIPVLDINQGDPIDLKPLCSYYMGQNYYDTQNWEIKSVHYESPIFGNDPKTGEPIKDRKIPIERLIYFCEDDYHIIPNSYGYGISRLQTILPLSEMNRNLNRRILPEIINTQWAGSGYWTAEGMSVQDMKALANQIKPGTHTMFNQQMNFQEIKLTHDLAGLDAVRKENYIIMLQQIGIPSVFIYNDITNRSVADKALLYMQKNKLDPERQRVAQQLWDYWYLPIVEAYYPDKEFISIRIKVLTEFKNIEYENIIDKFQAIVALVNANVISIEEARVLAEQPPHSADVVAQLEKNKQVADQLKAQPNQLNVNPAQNPNGAANQFGQHPAVIAQQQKMKAMAPILQKQNQNPFVKKAPIQ